VLTGASGILGSAFAAALRGRRLVCLGRADLDATDLTALLGRLDPGLVINCAADTDVEAAESAPAHSFAVNAKLPRALAAAAARCNAEMIHFSSTGCYGDWKDTPYTENDPLRPTTVHHRSKALGEENVMRAHPRALVLRLGWIFGGPRQARKNFVSARLREAAGRDIIGCNPVQRGCPTPAADVVGQALTLTEAGIAGAVNCVGTGPPASRLEYVEAILAAAGSTTRVVPVSFPRRAPVAANETAVNQRLVELGLCRMPPWRQALTGYVSTLLATPPA
jgi:dTDP-4-dehydrorhamnose reductase